MVRLLDSQSEGCGFESRQGPDVVFLGKGTLHEFSSLHPGGNGYPAIDSERSCQSVQECSRLTGLRHAVCFPGS